MNHLVLIGNLTADPEITTYGKGKDKGSVANFCLAVNRRYKDEDGEYPTDFFYLTAFGGQAVFLENYCTKGSKIAISAELRNNNYEKDGETVYRDQILVNNVELLKSNEVDKKSKRR